MIAKELEPFSLDKYKGYSAEELAVLIEATKGMWAILDPERHGQRRFRCRKDFLDAGTRLRMGLRAEFQDKPMRPYRRDWARRHRK